MALKPIQIVDSNGKRRNVKIYQNGKLHNVLFIASKQIIIDDYTYTLDAQNNIILETYIGAGGDIEVPVVEEE